jgi:hypothetical protein
MQPGDTIPCVCTRKLNACDGNCVFDLTGGQEKAKIGDTIDTEVSCPVQHTHTSQSE